MRFRVSLLLFLVSSLLLHPPLASAELQEEHSERTEWSWFADAAYRVRDGRAETRGFEFVQTELDFTHRFHPRLSLEGGVGYDHAGKTGFIPMAFLEAVLYKRGRIEADLLSGVFDAPLGIDYRYHGPADRWIFTDPMCNELGYARWNDAGHQFNLRHGNFKLKLMSFAGMANNYTLARSDAKGFRYEFVDPANEATRAGLFRIRDDSDGRAYSGLFADLHRGGRNLHAEWMRTEDFLDARGAATNAYVYLHGPLCAKRDLHWIARAERHTDGYDADRDGNEGMKRRRYSLGLRKVLSEGRELRFERRHDRDSGRVTGDVAHSKLSLLQMVWYR